MKNNVLLLSFGKSGTVLMYTIIRLMQMKLIFRCYISLLYLRQYQRLERRQGKDMKYSGQKLCVGIKMYQECR